MVISFLRVLRDIAIGAPSAPPTADSTVEGAIEVRAPGGLAVKYTPADNAEAPADFGAGVAVGALLFGATIGPALLVGAAAGAVVYLVQNPRPAPAAPPALPAKK